MCLSLLPSGRLVQMQPSVSKHRVVLNLLVAMDSTIPLENSRLNGPNLADLPPLVLFIREF